MNKIIQQGGLLMRNYILFATLILSSLVLLTDCGNSKKGASSNAPQLREKIGKTALEAIASAGFIEVEDIEPSKERGYAFTGFGMVLSDDKTLQLKALLLNDQSFDFEKMKSCLFVPKAAFHFKKENEGLVTILYSPWCKQIKVIDKDQDVILEVDHIANAIDSILKEKR